MKKAKWLIPAISATVIVITAAVYLLYKLAQASTYRKKWEDYDDYGWS
ncbi:MAG: hypothetical protein FWG45_02845 [Oscillospiraceae bacterium]|nr:hypothetical protein [Oscillospiraceae bacterium]